MRLLRSASTVAVLLSASCGGTEDHASEDDPTLRELRLCAADFETRGDMCGRDDLGADPEDAAAVQLRARHAQVVVDLAVHARATHERVQGACRRLRDDLAPLMAPPQTSLDTVEPCRGALALVSSIGWFEQPSITRAERRCTEEKNDVCGAADVSWTRVTCRRPRVEVHGAGALVDPKQRDVAHVLARDVPDILVLIDEAPTGATLTHAAETLSTKDSGGISGCPDAMWRIESAAETQLMEVDQDLGDILYGLRIPTK